jgi:hypothetical protein
MKKNYFLLLAFLLSLMNIYAEEYYAIKVVKLNGQEYSQAFALIGRLEFTADSMYLVGTDGQILGSELRTEVHKIAFGSDTTATAISSVEMDAKIHIYPNPVQQSLIIEGAQTNETIRIFTLNGTVITTAKVHDGLTAVDVSNLPAGQYLLQVNTQILKLIKQ